MSVIQSLLHPGRPLRILAVIGAIGLFCLLFVLGAISAHRGWLPANTDKIAHFFYYAGIASLIWIADGSGGVRARWLAIGLTAMLGVADELVQHWTPERQASMFDWVADVLGATLATLTLERLRAFTDTSAGSSLERSEVRRGRR
ncbi:MAG: VanZ family protein [Burkholderiaceae bacterium]